jgi:CheY-specific phosphatase CheX
MVNIKKTEEMLMKSIFEVFEKMFFIFAEPLRDKAHSCQMQAAISFSGPFTGEMQIHITNDLLRIMAKNILNLEDNKVTDAIKEDCLKEAINMICGSFLRKVEPEQVFNLSIPHCDLISFYPTKEQEQGNLQITLAFAAEDSAFEVRMSAADYLYT